MTIHWRDGWFHLPLVALLLSIAFAGNPSLAQTDAGDTSATDTIGKPENVADISGPTSVPAQLVDLAEAKEKSHPKWPTFPSLNQYDLSLGADYQVLYQHATESPAENDAAGNVARFYGQWSPLSSGAGALVFKMEYRDGLGTDITPKELGPTIGYAGLTAVTFSDAGAILTNLYWYQKFLDNRFAILGGIVDVTDYVDVYGLMNPWTDFNNYAFTTNPTIPAPDQGLGGVARWSFTPNIYIHAGFADANGDPGDTRDSIDSFFDTHEYFKHVEVGWVGSWEQRYNDNAHVALWQVDAREQAGVDSGKGIALSLSRLLSERWLPFIRAGYSDGGGALYERLISTGVGYQLDAPNHYVGVGASWGRAPTEATGGVAENQYTLEVFYRMQFFQHLQIVPSLQYIIDPAYNPSVQSVWIPSLRVRATF